MADTPPLIRLRNDPPHDAPAPGLADYRHCSIAVRLDPADDARLLIPHLAALRRIDIVFPKFRDGRGYSNARILRDSGYTHEIRAIGDVLVDQLAFLVRAGFDAFAPNLPIDPAVAQRTLARFPHPYMKAADGRQPIWALRQSGQANG